MSGPFTCSKMLLKINGNALGVVTGSDIMLEYVSSGVQHVYGSTTGKHVIGGDKASYTITRWAFSDTDTDLLFDLFNGKVPFALSGEIDGVTGTYVEISNCVGYSWRLVTGDANSTIGEEMKGEATSWENTAIT